jgi:hypothetical protein
MMMPGPMNCDAMALLSGADVAARYTPGDRSDRTCDRPADNRSGPGADHRRPLDGRCASGERETGEYRKEAGHENFTQENLP